MLPIERHALADTSFYVMCFFMPQTHNETHAGCVNAALLKVWGVRADTGHH